MKKKCVCERGEREREGKIDVKTEGKRLTYSEVREKDTIT